MAHLTFSNSGGNATRRAALPPVRPRPLQEPCVTEPGLRLRRDRWAPRQGVGRGAEFQPGRQQTDPQTALQSQPAPLRPETARGPGDKQEVTPPRGAARAHRSTAAVAPFRTQGVRAGVLSARRAEGTATHRDTRGPGTRPGKPRRGLFAQEGWTPTEREP